MPLQPSDIVLLSIAGRCFGQRILLTHHYRVSGAANPEVPTSAALNAFLTELVPTGSNPLLGAYRAVLPPEYEVDFGRAQVVWPIRSAYVQTEQFDGAGTYAGTAETSNQTCVVSLRTENGGRDQVANKHIGPLPIGAQVDGLVADAYRALLGTLATRLKEVVTVDISDQVFSPIIYHRKNPGTYDAITNHIVQTTVRTQRRRTVGLGE